MIHNKDLTGGLGLDVLFRGKNWTGLSLETVVILLTLKQFTEEPQHSHKLRLLALVNVEHRAAEWLLLLGSILRIKDGQISAGTHVCVGLA